ISIQFRIVEVEIREQFVFFENVVGYDNSFRIRHVQRSQLFETPDKECQLRLECCASLAIIERTKKRIVLRLRDDLRVEPLGYHPCQRALSYSDWSFDGDVARRFKKLGHDPWVPVICSG